MATYTILGGDTLSGIARRNNTTVANLMALNPQIKDANKIRAGATINLSGNEAANTSSTATAASTPQSAIQNIQPLSFTPRTDAELEASGTALYDPERQRTLDTIMQSYNQSNSAIDADAVRRGMARSSYVTGQKENLESDTNKLKTQNENEYAQKIRAYIGEGRAEDQSRLLEVQQFNNQLELQKQQLLQSILDSERSYQLAQKKSSSGGSSSKKTTSSDPYPTNGTEAEKQAWLKRHGYDVGGPTTPHTFNPMSVSIPVDPSELYVHS